MSTWFYYDSNGQKQGPVTGGQLKGLAKTGQISSETVVETEDGKTAPARKVKGLTFVETPLPETEQSESDYCTPYGRWSFQPWTEGGLNTTYRFDSEGTTSDKIKTLALNIAESVNKLSPKRFARLTGYKEKDTSCVWKLPDIDGLQPLAIQPPLPQENVYRIVTRLFSAMVEYHQHGITICDVTPSLVFVNSTLEHCVILPTPWLPMQAKWKPAAASKMPFAAPEVDTAGSNTALVDIYGFGAFTWFLLTGLHRKPQATMLPSEFDPDFARWDALIDSCCRTNPQRRFQTLQEVESALLQVKATSALSVPSQTLPVPVPAPSAIATVAPSHVAPLSEQAVITKRKSYVVKFVLLLVIGLSIIAYINRDKIANFSPMLGESITGYRRGFGDTILTYKNRSYEEAAWKEVKFSPLSGDYHDLSKVVGWQDDDYWVVDRNYRGLNVFRYKNGMWTNSFQKEEVHSRSALLLDRDSLLYGVHLFRDDGAQILDKGHYIDNMCYADNGLIYLMRGNDSMIKVSFRDVKTLGDQSTKYETITFNDKEYFVHKADNTITRSAVHSSRSDRGVKIICQIAPGKAIGMMRLRGYVDTNRGYVDTNFLVEFRNGIWYQGEELPERERYSGGWSAMWVDCSGTMPKHVVLVSDGGRVAIHQIGGNNRYIPVPTPQGSTSMDLCRVWGNSIDKFWTMDTNGTVWERNGNDWRVVVRGLRKEDIKFRDAWVSPTGNVFAITKDKLYELK